MRERDVAKWALQFAKRGANFDDDDEDEAPRRPAAVTAPRQASYFEQRWDTPPPPAHRGQVWGPPPETDLLVKPAPSAFAEIMASVPDLAPDLSGGGDAMQGRLTPESAAAMREGLLGQNVIPGVRPDDPKDAVPRGHVGVAGGYQILPLADLGKPN